MRVELFTRVFFSAREKRSGKCSKSAESGHSCCSRQKEGGLFWWSHTNSALFFCCCLNLGRELYSLWIIYGVAEIYMLFGLGGCEISHLWSIFFRVEIRSTCFPLDRWGHEPPIGCTWVHFSSRLKQQTVNMNSLRVIFARFAVVTFRFRYPAGSGRENPPHTRNPFVLSRLANFKTFPHCFLPGRNRFSHSTSSLSRTHTRFSPIFTVVYRNFPRSEFSSNHFPGNILSQSTFPQFSS